MEHWIHCRVWSECGRKCGFKLALNVEFDANVNVNVDVDEEIGGFGGTERRSPRADRIGWWVWRVGLTAEPALPASRDVLYGSNTLYVFYRLYELLYERLERSTTLCHEDVYTERRMIAHAVERAVDPVREEALPTGLERNIDLMDSLIQLLRGEITNPIFEQRCRQLVGTNGYFLFTMDRVVAGCIRQIQSLLSDPVGLQLIVRSRRAFSLSRLCGTTSDAAGDSGGISIGGTRCACWETRGCTCSAWSSTRRRASCCSGTWDWRTTCRGRRARWTASSASTRRGICVRRETRRGARTNERREKKGAERGREGSGEEGGDTKGQKPRRKRWRTWRRRKRERRIAARF